MLNAFYNGICIGAFFLGVYAPLATFRKITKDKSKVLPPGIRYRWKTVDEMWQRK